MIIAERSQNAIGLVRFTLCGRWLKKVGGLVFVALPALTTPTTEALSNDQYTPQNRRAIWCCMSRHSFDPEIAKQVGVNAAVIYQNIYWWCEKNAANGKHLHDGRFWTYNSVSAFDDLFPYLTRKQIRGALDKLLDVGLLVSGNYNEIAYDRTKWYSPTCPIPQADLPEKASSFAQKGKPIPDSKPNTKPVITPYSPPLPDWIPLDAWDGWIDMRKQLKKPLTERAKVRAINKLDAMRQAGQDISEVLDRSTMSGWTDLYEIKENNNGNGHRASGTDRRSSLARAIDEGIDFLGG